MSQYSKHDSSSSSSSSSSPDYSNSQRRSGTYESASTPIPNVFANDGSFMEMFKKYQQKQQCEEEIKKDVKKTESSTPVVKSPEVQTTAPVPSSSSKPTPAIPLIGKRKGGKILPTGKVKKVKNEDEEEDDDIKPKDAWSVYMSEVKRYRDTVCQSDDKTRPLVK